MSGQSRAKRAFSWWNDPWRKPRLLMIFTLSYVAWSLLPVLIAVLFSFNSGRSRTSWQGFSMRWYYGDPLRSVWHDATLHTALLHTLRLGVIVTLITIPLGVAMALGLDRWRGRLPEGANFAVLLSFVLPEILLAVALLFVATTLTAHLNVHVPLPQLPDINIKTGDLMPVHLGITGQVAGLVTFQLSYPVIIVRIRLLTIGPQYEEAAVDLGASPVGALRRVLLPMLVPAIFASTVLVFADVVDDFVVVRYLSGDASTEPVSVKIYNSARAAPTPALNALASLVLVASFVAIAIGFLAYRRFTRGERSERGIGAFAGEL